MPPRRLAPRALVTAAAAVALTLGAGAASASGQALMPDEIQRLHAMFDDSPLLGGQVPGA